MKVIVFGFDGLRPDCVTPEITPRLHKFLEENICCTNNRSVYPTETYVNHPSIFTGFLPERHGLVANAFFDTGVSKKDFFLGSLVDRIEHAERETRGGLFQVPSLTEIAAGHGLKCVSLSSNTAGSTRLIAHKTAQKGGINLSVNGIKHALPEDIREEFGIDPEAGTLIKPDLKGLRKTNEIFHFLTKKEGLSDLSIIWYGEPDNSFHTYGIGADESRQAITEADRCFGEIIDMYADGQDEIQVVVASDHGHITVKEHFDLTEALVKSGFRKGKTLVDPDADFVLLWGYSGNIYVLNQELIPDIAAALMEIPQVGMVFTRDRNGVNGIVEGTFSSRLVGGDSNRAGDIRFILRHTNEKDNNGYDGTCICNPFIPVGGSIHGGLHPSEVNSVLGWSGSCFKKNTIIDSVTGVIDITPTILKLLGIKPKILPQGRVLNELFKDSTENPPDAERRTFTAGRGEFSQKLEIDYIGDIPYIHRGGRV